MKKEIAQITSEEIARFWSYVEIKGFTECWLWSGPLDKKWRYGRFFLKGKIVKSHHVAAFLSRGWPDTPDLQVLHHCDNPPCCNPYCLFYGTQKDNMDDCAAKGRNIMQNRPEVRSGIKNPRSKLTMEQVREIRASSLTNSQLSSIYGVGAPRICRIKNNQSYKEVS